MAEEDFFNEALKDFYSAIESTKRFIDTDNPAEATNDIRHAGLEADDLEENNPVRAQSIGVRYTLVMAQEALGGSTLEKQDNLRRAREHWESAAKKANRMQDRDWLAGHLSEVQKKWKAKLNILWESVNDLIKAGSPEALKETEAKIRVAKDEDPSNSAYNWDTKLSEVRKSKKEDMKPGDEVEVASTDYRNIRSLIDSLMQRGHIFSNVELIDEALALTAKAVEDFKSNQELFTAALSLRNQVTLARDNLKNSQNMEAEGWEALKQGNLLKARSSYQNALINVSEASPRHKSVRMTLNKVESAVNLVEESARDEAAAMLSVAIKKMAEAKTLVGAPWVQIAWFDEALARLEGKQRLKDMEAKLEAAEFSLNIDNLHSVLNLLQQVENQRGIDLAMVKNHWQRYRTLRETLVSNVLQQAKDAEKGANVERAIELISKVSPLYTEDEFITPQYRELETIRKQWQKCLEELGRLLLSARGMLAEGNWEASATYYGRALEVIPNRAEAQDGLEVARGLQRTKLILHDHADRHQLKAVVKDMKKWAGLPSFKLLFVEKPYFSAQLKEAEQALKKANGQLWKRVSIFSGAGVVVVVGGIIALVSGSFSPLPPITPPPPQPPVITPVAEIMPAPLNPVRPMPTTEVKGYDPDKVEIYIRDNPGRTRELRIEPNGAYFRNKYIEMFNNDPSNRGLGKFINERQTDNGRELVFERGAIVWYKDLKQVKGSWY